MLSETYAPTRRIFANGQIALPGLTDAHIHTAQTLMRGLLSTLGRTKALRVPTWREYLVPFEASLTPDDVELSGQLAYSSMLATGTTSFFEAGGPHPESMARAAVETGIRGAVSLNTMDGGARIPESMRMSTEEALQRNIDLVDAWPHDPDGGTRVSACMSLRQIITCTPELVTGIHQAAQERGVKVHTHLVEGTYEIDYAWRTSAGDRWSTSLSWGSLTTLSTGLIPCWPALRMLSSMPPTESRRRTVPKATTRSALRRR